MYINPYQNLREGKWYKTNLHTHAGTGPNTCGRNPIPDVLELYKMANFEILCVSNHDRYTETSMFTDDDILLVPGIEYSPDGHILTIGIKESLRQLEMDHQQAVTRTKELGGFSIIAHPHWKHMNNWGERLKSMRDFHGIEILNYATYRVGGREGLSSGVATDVWDQLLSDGRLVWGFGNDDFHLHIDCNRAYSYVYCTERSYDGLKKAVIDGAVCASTGLIPEYLTLEDRTIKVCARHWHPNVLSENFTYRFIGENGKLLSQSAGKTAVYTLNGEKYVRVEVIAENGAQLFFQPVYNEELFKRP